MTKTIYAHFVGAGRARDCLRRHAGRGHGPAPTGAVGWVERPRNPSTTADGLRCTPPILRRPVHGSTSRSGRQQGAAMVEFSIVALLFFTIVLGIMEFGRILYLWNTVQEVTRRAAREAVVRDFTSQVSAIQREAVFQPGSSGTVYLPAGVEISNTQIQINYLNASLNVASPMPIDPADNVSACNDTTRVSSCIRFVEACVATDGTCTGTVTYSPMAGMFTFLAVGIPVSSAVMPAESLGFASGL